MPNQSALRYVFLRSYSNDELQAFLTGLLEKDLVIDHCKGNFLFFRRWHLKDARLCVVSADCSKKNAREDEQILEYLDIAKKSGWQLLCIGDYESLLPMRRRLYFYTSDPSLPPLEPDEAIDFQNAHRAFHGALRRTVLWLLLTAFALVSTVAFMLADGFYPAMALLDCAMLAVSCVCMTLCFDRKRLYDHVTKKKPRAEGSHLRLRRLERALLLSMGVLALSMALLLVS